MNETVKQKTTACWYDHDWTLWARRTGDRENNWSRKPADEEYRECQRPDCQEYQVRPVKQ